MTDRAATRDDIASDLFMALLAVNSWTLEKVGRPYPALRENGLFDVRALSGLEPEEIQERLSAAGYRRGPVLGAMMALRVQHVALALVEGGAHLLVDYEAAHDTAAARDYLLKMKGVGPTVVENYLLLRSSTAP
jgi:endonuclease III-like uncharacterized protein